MLYQVKYQLSYTTLSAVEQFEVCFTLQLYRTETYRISLLPEHKSGINDFDTKENTTTRYDTIEV